MFSDGPSAFGGNNSDELFSFTANYVAKSYGMAIIKKMADQQQGEVCVGNDYSD